MQQSLKRLSKAEQVPILNDGAGSSKVTCALQAGAAKAASVALQTRIDKQKAFADALRSGRCPDFESF